MLASRLWVCWFAATSTYAQGISTDTIASALGQAGASLPQAVLDDALQIISNAANTAQSDILQALTSILPLEKQLDPELYYSYGRSPPVYPSPQGTGAGSWADAYQKAKALVAQMTNVEKNAVVIPASNLQNCSGFVAAIPRLNFSGICLNDAESGLRAPATNNKSGYAAEISVGASWNTDLANQRAYYIGKEFEKKGVNVILGPVIGPLGRIAKGGRNWEGFSNDPYLSGALVGPTVDGFQQSVIACAKHFIANEQETNRNPFLQGYLAPLGINLNNSVSSNLDDRTMHELYLWPFYDAVKAGVGSVMASYNRINNSYASQNSKTMNGLLKTELGFQGFVVSDWSAQHTGIASALAGLDLAMPLPFYWGNDVLAIAVGNGSVPVSRLDDMATRILASWFRYAPFADPGITANNLTDARDPASLPTILQGAVEGHVLVKNSNSTLPLKQVKSMGIFGYDAPLGLDLSQSDGFLYQFAMGNSLLYENGKAFNDLQYGLLFATAITAHVPDVAFNGTMITGGGSGAVLPQTIVAPYDALSQQAQADGTTLYSDFLSQNPKVAANTDACLVFINAQSAEAADRGTLADPYSDALVLNVASQCSNTIVVIHNAGIRLVDNWINHPNVTAVLYAHLPGQASGEALVEVLYGRQSPSGRLPYTVAKSEADYGTLLNPTFPDAENPQYSQSNFTEGVHIDYRHFIQNNIEPRFAFGYGLTYSEFSYSNLTVAQATESQVPAAPPGAPSTDEVAPEGGITSLYDTLATVTAVVTNTGDVAAAEVAQLYLGIPNSDVPKALRGFGKQLIQPGASATFSFPLRRRDLSVWDVVRQQWLLQSGTYNVMVGKSVLDIQLEGTLAFSLD